MTMTVWMARNRPVPRNRATRSESRANQSGSTSNRVRPSRGWSSRRLVVLSGIGDLAVGARAVRGLEHGVESLCVDLLPVLLVVLGEPVAPVRGQQVVEHVVDGDR